MGRPTGSKDSAKRVDRRKWTKEEDKYLKDNFGITPNKQLCEYLKTNKQVLLHRARYLKLVKFCFQKETTDINELNYCGIYGIYNVDLDKLYIGSSCNITTRLKGHITKLNTKQSRNKYLQEDWGKYQFKYVLLYMCKEEDLLKYEFRFINAWPKDKRYNILTFMTKVPKITEIVDNKIREQTTFIENGCWIYNGKVDKSGYANVHLKGVKVAIHRLSYRNHFKVDPGYNVVMHTCHNKLCWNPEHLKLGSHKENANDYRSNNSNSSGHLNH